MEALKKDKRTSSEEVLEYIKDSIEKSSDRIFEASLIDMGNYFGIEAGTMTYHINKLEEEDEIKLIDKKGRHRRKRYVLPEDYELFVGLGSEEDFKKYLSKYKKDPEVMSKIHEKLRKEKSEKESSKKEELREAQLKKERLKKEKHEKENNQLDYRVVTLEPIKKEEPLPELTLDERIKNYLEEAQKYDEATLLLKQDDKDILAVLNETIQQNMVYLKDLGDQLSTLETKKMFLELIEEREKHLRELDSLKSEVESLRLEKNSAEKEAISPERVRQMQQIILSSVDTFINLPNQSMALQRLEFRNNLMKEVKDLVDYVLHIER